VPADIRRTQRCNQSGRRGKDTKDPVMGYERAVFGLTPNWVIGAGHTFLSATASAIELPTPVVIRK
jgi:hypothetical protein